MNKIYEYKETIKQMYSGIEDLVEKNKDIEQELFEQQENFFKLSFSNCNPNRMFFDWFVFDYKLQSRGKRVFDVFLEQSKNTAPKKLWQEYSLIANDRFGFFQVKALKTGKAFKCVDIFTEKIYQVFETTATKHIKKGDYFIGRLLPFRHAFILASDCLFYGKQDYDMFGMFLKNTTFANMKQIDAYKVYKALFPEPIPEQLPVKERFIMICQECSLSDYEIEDILLKMKVDIKNKNTSPHVFFNNINENLKKPDWFDLKEFLNTFMELWNTFVEEIHGGLKKGDTEKRLIDICMTEAHKQFPLAKNMSEEELKQYSDKMQKWIDKWFTSSKEHLNGKTPKEVILEEREQLGNPQKDVGFSLRINEIKDSTIEKKAEKIFYEAADNMNAGEYQKALNLYQEYNNLWDKNPVVWHNLGVCYTIMLQKRKAEQAFKKALKIKPDYQLARNKYEILKSMDKKSMVQMVRDAQKHRK